MAHKKGFIIIVLVQVHFIQQKQFNDRNVNSHNFKQISELKTFPDCFRGPHVARGPLFAHPCSRMSLFLSHSRIPV